uniref:Predicted protein n=1 Tax=Physcomitrium patens TaxID=3218 RepID=A9U7X5_PHYPA
MALEMASTPGWGHLSGCDFVQAHPDQNEQRQHEQVNRIRQNGSRFGNPAQVQNGNQNDQRTGDDHIIRVKAGKRRRNGIRPGRHADRHRQNIIDQQRAAGNQSGIDSQQNQNADTDRDRVPEGYCTDRYQHEQNLLGTIGNGGQRIGGQDGQRLGFIQFLFTQLAGLQRAADQKSFDG